MKLLSPSVRVAGDLWNASTKGGWAARLTARPGQELRGHDNPHRLLLHETHPVTLTVNSELSLEGARPVTYQPAGIVPTCPAPDQSYPAQAAGSGRLDFLGLVRLG